MDRIFINGARLPAHIGVTGEERAQPQDLIFDVTMVRDLSEAGRTDDYAKTVCYAHVLGEIEDILRNPFHLIEAVAEAVAAGILAGFAVEEVTVHIAKPGAFPNKQVDHAAVEITRRRDG